MKKALINNWFSLGADNGAAVSSAIAAERTFDNQIDSLVICSSGIYCLEVKTRNVKGTVFDFQDLAPGIYDQISYHQAAVQAALEAAGCAVDLNLIKSIVVVVDRGGKPKLTFKNQQFLVEHRFDVPVEQNVTYNAALNDLSMAGLSGSQQNFFWLIVGQLFRNAGQPVVLTARELKKMGDYRSNEVNQFNKAMSGLVTVMRTMPFFASTEYESRKLTVTLKRQYVPTFSMYSSESISWNNLLFRKIGNKFGKTLFRKLVQCANDRYCAIPIQDL